MLDSLPIADIVSSPTDTEIDFAADSLDHTLPNVVVSRNVDAREARLEAAEVQKYLMAKSFFDCREYDRCASVFLPTTLPKGQLPSHDPAVKSPGQKPSRPRISTAPPGPGSLEMPSGFPHLSQKALFLSLYAKYMAGEKRRDEETEMLLGPADSGAALNRELVGITQALGARIEIQEARGEAGQGWLEYLYGIVLAKGKNDDEARIWLLKSVNLEPYNWGAWQELMCLIANIDEVIFI